MHISQVDRPAGLRNVQSGQFMGFVVTTRDVDGTWVRACEPGTTVRALDGPAAGRVPPMAPERADVVGAWALEKSQKGWRGGGGGGGGGGASKPCISDTGWIQSRTWHRTHHSAWAHGWDMFLGHAPVFGDPQVVQLSATMALCIVHSEHVHPGTPAAESSKPPPPPPPHTHTKHTKGKHTQHKNNTV